jgi:hypothetical protein
MSPAGWQTVTSVPSLQPMSSQSVNPSPSLSKPSEQK